jgi:hypothetical protein
MDKNTKIGFAICGWCIINLAYSSAMNRRLHHMVSKKMKEVVDSHNRLVTDIMFASIVSNMDD